MYLGVDIGTSIAKGALLSQDGSVAAYSSFRRTGTGKRDPGAGWWEDFVRVTRGVAQGNATAFKQIRALAITAIAPNVYFIGHHGKPLCDAMLFYDNRAYDLELQLDRELQTPRWQNEVLSKVLWIHDQHRFAWDDVATVLSTHNYIVWRLTGELSIDLVTALEFGSLVRRSDESAQWNLQTLERYGIPSRIWPDIVAPFAVAGQVSCQASEVTGIPEKTPVVAGTTDSISSILSAGATQTNDTMIYYGTYQCAARLTNGLFQALSGEGQYPIDWIASIPRAGQQLVRVSELLFPSKRKVSVTHLDDLARQSSPGANGVVFVQSRNLPSSTVSTEPTGMFIGITPRTTRADLCRAVLESFGYGLRYFLSLSNSSQLNRCFAAGGGSKSDDWVQIVSDVTGLKQTRLPSADRAYGSALLAVGGADRSSLEHLIDSRRNSATETYPRSEHAHTYDQGYATYISAFA